MLLVAIFIVSLLAISLVSAADNTTNDVVSADNNSNDVIMVDEDSSKLSGNDYGNAESPFIPENNQGKSDIINPFKNENNTNTPTIDNNTNTEEISKDIVYFIEDKYSNTYVTYNANMVFKFNLQGQPFKCNMFVFQDYHEDWGDEIDEFYDLIPDEGYLTLNKYYKPGFYIFRIICYLNNKNSETSQISYPVVILDDFGPDGYKNMKIETFYEYYDEGTELDCSWKGVFNGVLKIYQGNKVIKTIKLHNGDSNIEGSDSYIAWFSVGTYVAKVIDKNGKVAAQKTFKILKTPTKTKIKSLTVKPGSKKTICAYVEGKGGTYYSGYVKFNIMGKTYKVKIKNGVAKVTVNIPKKTKTYSCKATFLGDKNAKSSSTTFKIIAKKTIKFTVVVPTKLNKKISKYYGKYKVQTYKWVEYKSNGKAGHIKISVYKNGKKLTNFKSKYYVHYNSGGGAWIYNNYEGHKTTAIGYKNFLKVYKVTATVWA